MSDDPELRKAYLIGYYDACARLTTSPRMNKPQIAVIQQVAGDAREKLEAMGVAFSAPHPSEGVPA